MSSWDEMGWEDLCLKAQVSSGQLRAFCAAYGARLLPEGMTSFG